MTVLLSTAAGSAFGQRREKEYWLTIKEQKAKWRPDGPRRGNHEVMIRGTFANFGIKNNQEMGYFNACTSYAFFGKPLSTYCRVPSFL
ncbi:MAG TPA: hypothetical protein VFX43_13480 [Chitinophagaceae bacterium]|nr:hypothetical protein [Chitinophagaceae bacterium]